MRQTDIEHTVWKLVPLLTMFLTSQVSAFAAQKWRQGNTEITSSDGEAGSDESNVDTDSDGEAPLTVRDGSEAGDSDSAPDDGSKEAHVRANFQLSTCGPHNGLQTCTEDLVVMRLQMGQRVTFIGQYALRVKSGFVSIYGYSIGPSHELQQVFAPSTHALPHITCISDRGCEIEAWHCTRNITMRPLIELSPLYRHIWNDCAKDSHLNSLTAPSRRSFSFIEMSSHDPRPLHPLEILPRWRVFADRYRFPAASPIKLLVCGRKDSGKSTFCRFFANNLLSKLQQSATSPKSNASTGMYFLDLDPGQSEFSPPGQISLVRVTIPIFGPPYSHAHAQVRGPHVLVAAHYIGATSPIDDPEFFLACALDLQRRYEAVVKDSPQTALVINSPGWSEKGWFGLELTLQIMQNLHATDIVHLGDLSVGEGNDPFFAAIGITPLHKLPSIGHARKNSIRTASELRDMQTLSYFHSTAGKQSFFSWNPKPVSSQKPMVLRYNGRYPDILGIVTVTEHPPTPDLLAVVLRKWLVAICIMEDDDEVLVQASRINRTRAEKLPYWPVDATNQAFRPAISTSHIVGWAYVASIDPYAQTLSLSSPLDDSTWQTVRSKTKHAHPRIVLVRGQTDTPSWAYLEPVYRQARQNRRKPRAREGSDVAVQFEASELPSNYDMSNEERNGLDGTEYVERVKGPTSVGGKEWTLKPRMARLEEGKTKSQSSRRRKR